MRYIIHFWLPQDWSSHRMVIFVQQMGRVFFRLTGNGIKTNSRFGYFNGIREVKNHISLIPGANCLIPGTTRSHSVPLLLYFCANPIILNERLGINFDKGPLVDKVTMNNKYF
jgi:hypothetical protein